MNLLKKFSSSSEEPPMKCPCTHVFELCSHIVEQSHHWHLVTESYAEHKALNVVYDTLPGLMDDFIEAYQGVNGRMKAVPQSYPIVAYDAAVVREYFDKVYMELTQIREPLIPHLQSDMDVILSFIAKVKYLLTLS